MWYTPDNTQRNAVHALSNFLCKLNMFALLLRFVLLYFHICQFVFVIRFLHRTIVTKKELKLYHLAEDNKCISCFNADSIEHTFIDCKESVKLYSQIISWFNHSQSTEIILSKEQIAFHDTSRDWCAVRPFKTQARFAHHPGQTIYLCF